MRRRQPDRVRPLRIPESVYTLVERLFEWGGAAFIIGVAYVGWGLFTGRMDSAMHLPPEERFKIAQNVLFACKIIGYGGLACLIGAAARFWHEETVGYVFLIAGAALYWGVAALVGPSVQGMRQEAGRLAVFALAQIQTLGFAALALAVPFILADFWARLSGARRFRAKVKPSKSAAQEPVAPSRSCLFCWQMPYCRDYLRKVCTAYETKKTCWRIKSGCYCDENMILKVLQKSKTSKIPGFDQKFSKPDVGAVKNLTPAQKRERCRQCFLYMEHQKWKYKLLSPLAFPAVIGLIWYFLEPMKALLGRAIAFTDQFAGVVSFGPSPEQVAKYPWLNVQESSGVVEWIFIICIGFIAVSYLLRLIEYAVFDLKI
ncbi:MAG: hypothetical protein KBC96_07135 [Armatimonadetes bacterium]|nr:hypothetical protein [Armatimonadota bacterium]